jgi:cytochrome c oxidase assembly factor CtaG
MNHLLEHWSPLPSLVIVLAFAGWHEIGLRRLLRRTRRDRVTARRQRSLWFYGGLTVLFIAVGSPLEHWGYDYFYIHMIQHLLLLFAVPSMVVAGAPWQPLILGLPLRVRRRSFPSLLHDARWRPARSAARFLASPVPAVAAFNLAMVGWQIPGPFELAERDAFVHSWLMNAGMLLVGVLFWRQFIPSPPLRMRLGLAGQAAALVATNLIMWLLAMSMSLFSHHGWYSVYDHIAGVRMSPFADQLIGAGILWVCGDFWAVPALIVVVRRLIAREQGQADSAIERMLADSQAARAGTTSGLT